MRQKSDYTGNNFFSDGLDHPNITSNSVPSELFELFHVNLSRNIFWVYFRMENFANFIWNTVLTFLIF